MRVREKIGQSRAIFHEGSQACIATPPALYGSVKASRNEEHPAGNGRSGGIRSVCSMVATAPMAARKRAMSPAPARPMRGLIARQAVFVAGLIPHSIGSPRGPARIWPRAPFAGLDGATGKQINRIGAMKRITCGAISRRGVLAAIIAASRICAWSVLTGDKLQNDAIFVWKDCATLRYFSHARAECCAVALATRLPTRRNAALDRFSRTFAWVNTQGKYGEFRRELAKFCSVSHAGARKVGNPEWATWGFCGLCAGSQRGHIRSGDGCTCSKIAQAIIHQLLHPLAIRATFRRDNSPRERRVHTGPR